MKGFLIKQALLIFPVGLLVSLLAFSLVRVFPSDVVASYLKAHQQTYSPENVAMVRARLGLDKPIIDQYFDWLKKAARFDFGQSYYGNLKVSEIIFMGLKSTLQLTAATIVWLLVVTYFLGLYAAKKPDGLVDNISRLVAILGNAVPIFVVGFLLIQIFALKLGWLPVSGKLSFKHVILPSLTLALSNICVYARMLRNEMLDNSKKAYVFYAKARGLRTSWIFKKHIFKNSLLPMAGTSGICFGHLICGSVIVENVFAWPGLGTVITYAILSRNYPVIQGYVVCVALIFIVANLCSDILTALLDPRVRLGSAP
ncbi:MAG: ABC transporter permease [Deltaproteobacteria bacterium]|jgi:ABC-type dipeptide/oligopeptide/nickel transport system permease component|nr:ABC transporter permease [Deltaproteobacteria bacterium]